MKEQKINKEKLIEALQKEIERSPYTHDYGDGYHFGLNVAIAIIKNMKGEKQ